MAATPRPKAGSALFAALVAITLVIFVLHVGYGSTSGYLGPAEVIRQLLRGPGAGTAANDTVWQIRLVRALGCLCIGGILGGVGSAFQALFRNPLADPFIVGVSSGAATGSVIAMIAGFAGVLGGIAQAGAAFAGGLASLALVLVLSGRRGRTNVVTLLLAGVVIGAMLSAVMSLLILLSGRDSNEVLKWLLGSTDDLYWPIIALLAFALIVGSALLISQSRALNAFAIGEETARRLGVDTRRLKSIVLVAGTGMVSIAVGAAGIIGFLGLVAPHISRGLFGTDWRRSLAGSVLVGGCLLLLADALAQRIGPTSEWLHIHAVAYLPVGVVTAILGAPSLLILLRRSQGR
ncbi:MAG TPA: iron ABC transporter permease [Fimbriimonadaceae bacterium]|nr:iron ABC transporter permease [Fimbriimonadaceae bacterium]